MLKIVDGVAVEMTAEEIAAKEAADAVQVRRLIPKSAVQERAHAIGKLDDVMALLQAPGNAIYYARWFAPDWPNVYFDDPQMLAMLDAVGCTEEEIEAITA